MKTGEPGLSCRGAEPVRAGPRWPRPWHSCAPLSWPLMRLVHSPCGQQEVVLPHWLPHGLLLPRPHPLPGVVTPLVTDTLLSPFAGPLGRGLSTGVIGRFSETVFPCAGLGGRTVRIPGPFLRNGSGTPSLCGTWEQPQRAPSGWGLLHRRVASPHSPPPASSLLALRTPQPPASRGLGRV